MSAHPRNKAVRKNTGWMGTGRNDATWKKSSRSNGNGGNNCWLFLFLATCVRLYDTKTMSASDDFTNAPYLELSYPQFYKLIGSVFAGAFDNFKNGVVIEFEESTFTLESNGRVTMSNQPSVAHVYTPDETDAWIGVWGEDGGVYGGEFGLPTWIAPRIEHDKDARSVIDDKFDPQPQGQLVSIA